MRFTGRRFGLITIVVIQMFPQLLGAVAIFLMMSAIGDVFPAFGAHPLRIEFFGDEVESLRAFDPTTQRSTEKLEMITILPGREIVISEKTAAPPLTYPTRSGIVRIS